MSLRRMLFATTSPLAFLAMRKWAPRIVPEIVITGAPA